MNWPAGSDSGRCTECSARHKRRTLLLLCAHAVRIPRGHRNVPTLLLLISFGTGLQIIGPIKVREITDGGYGYAVRALRSRFQIKYTHASIFQDPTKSRGKLLFFDDTPHKIAKNSW
jgi:hypothetical protein